MTYYKLEKSYANHYGLAKAASTDPVKAAYDACHAAGDTRTLTEWLEDAGTAAQTAGMSLTQFLKMLAGSPSDLQAFVQKSGPRPVGGASTTPATVVNARRTGGMQLTPLQRALGATEAGVRAELRRLGRDPDTVSIETLEQRWRRERQQAEHTRALKLGVPARTTITRDGVRDVSDGSTSRLR